MRRIVAALLAGLALSFAAAFELPSDGQIVVRAEGQVVGQGSFEDGDLELDLLAGFSGFATVTVVDPAGSELSFEVMISEDGTIMLAEEAGGVYLIDLVSGEVVISFEEGFDVEVEGRNGNAFGAGVPEHVDLPEVAVAGQAGAEANHAEARAKAESNEDEEESASAGAEGRARGEASAGARGGEAEAEAEAEIGIGVGVGGGRED